MTALICRRRSQAAAADIISLRMYEFVHFQNHVQQTQALHVYCGQTIVEF
jgi:hypothetical protein